MSSRVDLANSIGPTILMASGALWLAAVAYQRGEMGVRFSQLERVAAGTAAAIAAVRNRTAALGGTETLIE